MTSAQLAAIETIGVVLTLAAILLALWRPDISSARLERRYGDATSRFLDLPGGVRLHYRDLAGENGPVLVFLHGFTASSLDWAPLLPELGRVGRVLLLDLPGHGLTDAPREYRADTTAYVALVAAFVAALRLERYVLVGSSMGGLVAWRHALQRDPALVGLVLVGAVGWTEGSRPSAGGVLRLFGLGLGRVLIRHFDMTPLVRRGLRTTYADPHQVTPALVRRYMDLARGPGHRRILTTMRMEAGDERQLAGLATLDLPSLVVTGELDRLVPPADARRFAAAIPGATLVTYADVGHVPMQEVPAALASDLRAWLVTHALVSG